MQEFFFFFFFAKFLYKLHFSFLLGQGGPPLHLLCAVVARNLQKAPEAPLPPQRGAAEVSSRGGEEEGRGGEQAPR